MEPESPQWMNKRKYAWMLIQTIQLKDKQKYLCYEDEGVLKVFTEEAV